MINATPNATVDDSQLIDTNDFNVFDQLNDLVVESPEHTANETEAEVDPALQELTLESDETGFDFDDIDDGVDHRETELGEKTDTDAIEEQEAVDTEAAELDVMAVEEQQQFVSQNFKTLPDDFEIDGGDGVVYTKGDLINSAKQSEQNKEINTFYQKQLNDWNQWSDINQAKFDIAETEVIRHLNSVNQQLQDPSLTYDKRGQLSETKDTLIKRQEALTSAGKEAMSNRMEQRQIAVNNQIDSVQRELSKSHSNEAVTSAIQYANEAGITGQQIAENISVGLIETLMKAKKYDDIRKDSKESIRKKSLGKSVPKGKKASTITARAQAKRKASQAIASGNNDGVFAHLVD
ncbi:hypothetical protein RGQ13_08685 [Thalassotalea psychrophila]|uniref:Uncharacterized protein n=1 Tax=Thalassotalea psychrophila TaxID=3065647 RepID=A0ABY9TYV9_9GAMM|nr:hypothetical protein RGQ13_08685 [Colwelliaceae bacterium SQ149]